MSLATGLVNAAYLSAIYVGGGNLSKGVISVGMHCLNYCGAQISERRQKQIKRISECIGGMFFVILATRCMDTEKAQMSKQINNLKNNVKDLEKDVDTLFKSIYSKGKDVISNLKIHL